MRFQPPSENLRGIAHARLALHQGFWSPMVRLLGPRDEVIPLRDSIVELENLPFAISTALPKPLAVVEQWDSLMEYYVASVGNLRFPVERMQMKQVVFRQHGVPTVSRASKQPAQAQRKDAVKPHMVPQDVLALNGIPEASLEFQVLNELVRRQARLRLERMMQELAGRGGESISETSGKAGVMAGRSELPAVVRVPDILNLLRSRREQDAHLAAVAGARQAREVRAAEPARSALGPAPPPVALQTEQLEHVSLDAARKLVSAGQTITVLVLSDWAPDETSASSRFLPVKSGMRITLKRHSDGGWWFGFDEAKPDGVAGWCPEIHFILWEVTRPFRPEASSDIREQFLDLNVGDGVLVITRWSEGDWSGWGFGEKYGTRDPAKGLFCLSCATPKVILNRTS